MAEILKVEPEALNAMADRFTARAEQIQNIIGNFNATITLIQNGSFKGQVGDAAQEKFANEYEPRLKTFQQKLVEISDDLKLTVTDYIAEDEDVSSFFGDGAGGGGGNAAM